MSNTQTPWSPILTEKRPSKTVNRKFPQKLIKGCYLDLERSRYYFDVTWTDKLKKWIAELYCDLENTIEKDYGNSYKKLQALNLRIGELETRLKNEKPVRVTI